MVELVQRNTEVTIPFLVSSLGYGFLWNNPGIGRTELGTTGTRWVSEAPGNGTTGLPPPRARGHPPPVRGRDGRPPMLRMGNRILAVQAPLPHPAGAAGRGPGVQAARPAAVGDRGRLLPLDTPGRVAVRPKRMARSGRMVAELDRLGVKLMVSIWPTVNPASENYSEMAEEGLLVATERGIGVHLPFWDKGTADQVLVSYYDATNPRAREYIWSKAREGYFKHGVRAWWLDEWSRNSGPSSPTTCDITWVQG